MTVDELCDLFGLSRHTVNMYVKRGIIPPPIGKTRNARYGTAHVEAIRAWQALQHNNVIGRDVIAYCREEGIALVEYVQRRTQAIRDFGIGVG